MQIPPEELAERLTGLLPEPDAAARIADLEGVEPADLAAACAHLDGAAGVAGSS